MDHKFQASQTNSDVCVRCKYNQRAHSNFAQCETCPTIGICEIFTDMLMCAKCIDAERRAITEYQAPEKQEARLQAHNAAIANHKPINLFQDNGANDTSPQLDTDIFNAKTNAFVDIYKQIDSDESISNKPLAKAEYVHNKRSELQKLIFDLKKQLNEAENGQRAAQVQLNQLANSLRAEERERLKISDISYQPTVRKQPKPKSTGTKAAGDTVKKLSNKQIVEQANLWATKIGMPGTVIHMRMLSKNMSAEVATRTLAAELNLTVKE